jgi:glycosyltransferase involved in cell wall biosynthesis
VSDLTTQVLHLIKGLGPGGAEQLLVNQARVTDDDGLRFTVAYLVTWKNHNVSRLEEAGWVTVCLNGDRIWDLRWALRLRQELRKRDIEVVHGHSPLVSAVARLINRTIPRKQRPRFIYTEHNEWGRHNRWTRLLNRLTIRFEDHVIAVSEAVKNSMSRGLEVEVLIHGIDVEEVAGQKVHRDEVRRELGIAEDEYLIGIVANFRKEKAYDVLLDAAAKVVAQDDKVRFVSVGQGPLENEIRAQHERLGLGDRFLLLGYREDATRIMSGFDLFTLSSLHEGLPVSLMEAMALDLPIVATKAGGVPSALVGCGAVLVEPGDVDQLARALSERRGTPENHVAVSFPGREAVARSSLLYQRAEPDSPEGSTA